MELQVKKVNPVEARIISTWTYEEPYSIYSMEGDEDSIKELLNGNYFSVTGEKDNLIGYYCFGESAQVPAGNEFGVYDHEELIDIGLGINPLLCGRGLGEEFLKNGINFARTNLSANGLRLTVAAFNKRGIKVYTRGGFNKINSFRRVSDNGETEFWVMTLS